MATSLPKEENPKEPQEQPKGSLFRGALLLFISSFSIVYYFSPQLIPQLNHIYANESPAKTSNHSQDKSRAQIINVILPQDSVLTETNYGKLLGYKVREQGKEVHVFLGIPFATPPLGGLRFKKPRSLSPWKGVCDATRYGHQCIQHKPNKTYTPWISNSPDVSEDCLYLNIWAPQGLVRGQKQPRKPVMVFIHGGAFFSGSSDLAYYEGRVLAAFGDVVVVTINYRLGAFGFLDARLDEAPGNQGLHDQVMALKWVHENIKYFGGNPEEVTLFGQSAGAISIGLHYVSPLSQGYFKRGILQSGAPTVSRIFYERETELANKVPDLAQMVGCLPQKRFFARDAEAVVECLRSVKTEAIMRAQGSLIEEMSLSFGPTSGDDFLPDIPSNLLREGLLGPQKEALMGVTSDEGTFFLHYFDPVAYGHQPSNLTYDQSLQLLKQSFKFSPPNYAKLVFDMFLSWAKDKDPLTVRTALSDFIGDSTFTCPATLFAHLLDLNNRSVYFYVFEHRTSKSPWAPWMGAIHFDEIPYVFGYPLKHPHEYLPHEVEFSKQIMSTWVTFARQGYPESQLLKSWPQYTKDEAKYVRLSPSGVSVGENYREKTCSRWRLLLENS